VELADPLVVVETADAELSRGIWTTDENGNMVGEQPSWSARANDLQLWEHAVVARGPCDYEHRMRRHDGQYRYFSVNAVPVFDEHGAIREWVGIHSDITQRKLTEQSLRDGKRRFRELADAMPQIVWGARPEGQLDYHNKRWYETTGRPESLNGDASWADAVHPEDRDETIARWRAAVASGDSLEIESRLRHKDGDHRWYLQRALPVRDRPALPPVAARPRPAERAHQRGRGLIAEPRAACRHAHRVDIRSRRQRDHERGHFAANT
jgi:PAS domain S-box-containing protein